MARIMDKNISKPKMQNKTYCWVWEVTTEEWDDKSDEYEEVIKGVFFDPWKATEWAMKIFGINSGVRASLYHIDNCK